MWDTFYNTTDMQVAIRYQHKYACVSKHSFHIEAMIDKVLSRKWQKGDESNHGIINPDTAGSH